MHFVKQMLEEISDDAKPNLGYDITATKDEKYAVNIQGNLIKAIGMIHETRKK